MENLNEEVSRIKSMMKMVNEGEYTKEGDINELGGYIGDAPEKISGPKIAKIDPRIHEGYSGYDVLKAQKLLLNIYSYGDIEIPTEDYLKLSNYMEEIYKSVKYDENWEKNHGESSVENDDYDERQERNYGVEDETNEEVQSTPKLIACRDIGVKFNGLCDKATEQPVVKCAELKIKSPGYCFVGTRTPV